LGEGEEEEGTTSKGIDRPDGGPSKYEVHETESERGDQRRSRGCASFDEDGGGIESNNINAAHLLSNHDHERSKGSSSDAGDSEELEEARNVGALTNNSRLLLQEGMDVIEIASCLQLVGSQPKKRFVSICVTALLHIPSRRLGTEENSNHERNGGDESTPKLQSPCNLARVHDSEISNETQEDTERGPQLPGHHERSPDGRGSVLSSVNGYRRPLATHSEPEKDTADKELGPRLGEGGTDDGKETENGGGEDRSATADVVVNRV